MLCQAACEGAEGGVGQAHGGCLGQRLSCSRHPLVLALLLFLRLGRRCRRRALEAEENSTQIEDIDEVWVNKGKVPLTLAETVYCNKVDINWEDIIHKAKQNELPFNVPESLINRPIVELEFHYEQMQKERILKNRHVPSFSPSLSLILSL